MVNFLQNHETGEEAEVMVSPLTISLSMAVVILMATLMVFVCVCKKEAQPRKISATSNYNPETTKDDF